MIVHANMLPSSHAMKHTRKDAFDLMNPLPHKPRTKRSAESRAPEVRIEDYPQWVAIVLDSEGRSMLKSSPNMKQYRPHILEPEARAKFERVSTDFIDDATVPVKRQKPRKSSTQSVEGRSRDGQVQPYSRKNTKRRHQLESYGQSSYFVDDSSMQPPEPPGNRKISLAIDDDEAQAQWFSKAFRAVQQIGCRTIAKVWIKKIHPKKQSTHPYNGNVPRDHIADANRTKPPYWPLDVIHKEPDHVDKTARTKLLVHLIVNTPQKQIKSSSEEPVYIRAVDLLAALEEKKADFKEEKWAIVQEIIAVREQIEEYRSGNLYLDPNTSIFVTDFTEQPKSCKTDPDAGADEDAEVKSEDDERETFTPNSGESPTAPSPDDQIRQIAQSSTRLSQDVKTVVSGVDHGIVSSEALDFIPMMDEETAQMIDPQAAFDVQHMVQGSNFGAMSSAQSHPALTVNTQNLYAGSSGPSFARRGPQRGNGMRQKQFSRRDVQHQQELVRMQNWPNGESAGQNTSPTDFMPVEYTFNGTQCHTPIPNQTFRMAEVAMSAMTDGSSSVDMALSEAATPTTLLSADHPLAMHHSVHHPQQYQPHPGSASAAFMHGVGMPHHLIGRPIPTRTMSSASHHQVSMMDAHHHQQIAAAAAVAAASQDLYFP